MKKGTSEKKCNDEKNVWNNGISRVYCITNLYFLQDHDGHGPNFKSHMNRINDATGAAISVSLLVYLL